ncbi:hypothetical protein [uncultured Jannaschia sp.]|uniref:hypothetical protein n=1 Tax=uncultured Jannaschia sp. TaxID=293347 RepID=UPI00261211AC|nr:hypothetical protein [uncultured Jannaschia sp.]
MFRFLTIAIVLAGTAAEATPTARCNAIREMTEALVRQSADLSMTIALLMLEPAFAESEERKPTDYSAVMDGLGTILGNSNEAAEAGFAAIDEFCTIKRP